MNPVDVEEGCIVFLGGAGVEETEFRTNPLAFTNRERIAYLDELLAIQTVAPFCNALYLVGDALAVYLYAKPYILGEIGRAHV